jgi:hypothetical protein
MRKLVLPCVVAIACMAITACHKGDHGVHLGQSITIDTTIASGSLYQLNLQPYGDADDVAKIKTQATNYTTSEIINSPAGFSPVYRFSAVTTSKASLTDQVVIAITEGTNGNHPKRDTTFVTINFKIQ